MKPIVTILALLAIFVASTEAAWSKNHNHGWRHDNGRHNGWFKNRNNNRGCYNGWNNNGWNNNGWNNNNNWNRRNNNNWNRYRANINSRYWR